MGTCRVIEPARYLRKSLGKPALPLRHRLHNPHQIEQAIAMVAGEPAFDRSTIHLLSERSCKETLAEGKPPEHTLDGFAKLRLAWAEHDVFVIEISSMKDFFVELGRRRLSVSTHAERDLLRYCSAGDWRLRGIADVGASDIRMERMTGPNVIAGMGRIKRMLARPIIWVGHINVLTPSPETKKVYETRKSLAETLRRGAGELGDTFYDPTEVVRELGQENAMEKSGADLFHTTRAGIEFLADRFWALCAEARLRR